VITWRRKRTSQRWYVAVCLEDGRKMWRRNRGKYWLIVEHWPGNNFRWFVDTKEPMSAVGRGSEATESAAKRAATRKARALVNARR